MENKIIIFSPGAEQDLKKVLVWYQGISFFLKNKFKSDLDVSLDLIKNNPEAWPLHKKQVRKFFMKEFPYIIFYLFEEETIYILGLFHGRRKPSSFKDFI